MKGAVHHSTSTPFINSNKIKMNFNFLFIWFISLCGMKRMEIKLYYNSNCYYSWNWPLVPLPQHNPRKQTSQTKNEINLLMEWIVGGVWLDWIVVGYGWGPSPLPRMNSIPDNSCLSFRHSCSFFIKYRKAKNKRHSFSF